MAEIIRLHGTKDSSNPSRQEVWREFRDDRSLRQIHKITDHEMALLERTALLGEFNSAEDLLFMLKAIRGGALNDLERAVERAANDASTQRNS
jgi:hypothetical protein